MCTKLCGGASNVVSPSDDEDEESRTSDGAPGATLVKIAIFQVNPVTKTGIFMIDFILTEETKTK